MQKARDKATNKGKKRLRFSAFMLRYRACLAGFTGCVLLLLAACTNGMMGMGSMGGTDKTVIRSGKTITKTYPYAPDGARIEFYREGPSQEEINKPTRIIMLGTGSPIGDVFRASTGIAVVHRGKSYLFDVGSGVIRRAIEARYMYDIPSLMPPHISGVFITHLHSDHTLDYDEFSHFLWWYRLHKAFAYGPEKLQEMTENMYKMMESDRQVRLASQPVPPGADALSGPDGYKLDVRLIEPGIIFDQDGMQVEAFEVIHGAVKPAYGFKVTTDDLTFVISGDTQMSPTIREKARDVDYLIHEAINTKALMAQSQFWQDFHRNAHTTGIDVGKLAAEAKPKAVILYHTIHYGMPETDIIDEVKQFYDGPVFLAHDLQLFE